MNLLRPNSKPDKFIDKYSNNMGTICDDKDAISTYEEYFALADVKYNLIPDESGFRRKIRKNRVIFGG